MKRCVPALPAFTLILVGTWPAVAPAADTALAVRALDVLKARCARCHGAEGTAKGGFGYVLDRGRLLARGKIVPGAAEESELYRRVRDGEMPPAKAPRLSVAEMSLLRSWIEAGAPPARSPAGPRAFVTDGDVFRWLVTDLRSLPPRQRRFKRYLTLAPLYNAGRPEEELQSCRAAVAKLLNSLSWHPRVSVPEPVGPAATLLRLDLRDYQWNARAWDRLASAYPYRLPGGPEAQAASGMELPCLRADWFVATASRPPLYHDLLQLPATDRELERMLRVDLVADLEDDSAMRAGFTESGVSRNNRLIERHDAAYGAYWRSYDFSDNVERQNLFNHPLGPVPGRNSFQHAGGELIFNLPNGLQGYMLVDGEGRRLDKAPVAIVSDPRRPDRAVEAGLSCMACHARGLIPKADKVRAHVLKNPQAFDAADTETVLALYPPERELRARMGEDMERFRRALARCGVLPDDPEPISAVVGRYEAALDLGAAAAELGLPAEEFARRLRASPLSRALGGLLVGGGTVQRSTFQAAFAYLAGEFRPASGTLAGAAEEDVPAFRPFAGHRGYILSVAVSGDGRCAVTGSDDGTARLWDVASGRELHRFESHGAAVLCVAFSPDDRRIISGGRDRKLHFWDTATGKERLRCTGHTDDITAATFPPDGKCLLSAGRDGTLRLWDAETGKELRTLAGHDGAVLAVAFAPDGRHALSGGRDGTVRLWDLETGREVRRFTGQTREVFAVAVSPDGRRALSGGNDRTVRLWDMDTGAELRRFPALDGAAACVAFSPDGRRVLAGNTQYRGPGQPLHVWDAQTGQEAVHFGETAEAVWSIAFAPAGDLAVTGTSAKTLRLWRLAR